jgi:ABC-type multidrug transport system permease subunit
MAEAVTNPNPAPRFYSPLLNLVIARLKEFYREPEALFWVYGFPIFMTIALGIAFRNQGTPQVSVDVVSISDSGKVLASLGRQPSFVIQRNATDAARRRLRSGKTDVVLLVESTKTGAPRYVYEYDPSRPESVGARDALDDALQRAAGRKDVVVTVDEKLDEPGGRYIDFLIPGLLGMSLMGGGLWGVGFVTVDLRIRKLLKRFIATPMKKRDFLAGIMLSRMTFMIPEVAILLIFARLAFGVTIQGSLLAMLFLILLGAVTFSGIGLLVASRAKTIEAVSGLMNLVMVPMWIFSGIFFSSERFPEAAQPFILALPLTPLIRALREVMLEGATLWSQAPLVAILVAYAAVTFSLALRLFRWQ